MSVHQSIKDLFTFVTCPPLIVSIGLPVFTVCIVNGMPGLVIFLLSLDPFTDFTVPVITLRSVYVFDLMGITKGL